MRSSEGAYYARLDHVRALAAFLVFFWHGFRTWGPAELVPSLIPLSLLEEGHTGVSVFMVLSGYLFAKITDQKDIAYPAFLWNRFVRLAPLLAVVFLYSAVFSGFDFAAFFQGLIFPVWPVTAWSLTVEIHFYIIFPLLIFIQRKFGTSWLTSLVILSVSFRSCIWLIHGEVQSAAYWTIVGRFDQFLLGIVFFYASKSKPFLLHAHWILLASLVGFSAFWHYFNQLGGFFGIEDYPSRTPLWIIIPTIEAVAFGSAIASYENLKIEISPRLDSAIAYIGKVSYSIYLLHYIVIVDFLKPVMPVSLSILQTTVFTLAIFPLVLALSGLSYRYIESPFMRFRIRYLRTSENRRVAKDIR